MEACKKYVGNEAFVMNSMEFAASIEPELIRTRRDLHRHAEPGWTEYRSAAMVAATLEKLGFTVKAGPDVICADERMGLPSPEADEAAMERAAAQGADPKWLNKIAHGFTGVVGIMEFSLAGPVTAFRFDMDCNDVDEAQSDAHIPFAQGFASENEHAMHACGHDGHTTIGLGLARYLASCRDSLKGTVKLLFQPAEEGCRGARAMAASGIVDDVDYLFGMHVGGAENETGTFACRCVGSLATTKLDVTFQGVPSHAGSKPEAGKNALLAACTALLNLHAISRTSAGMTRVNVGVLQGGTGRNVIAGTAFMKMETRGETTAINEDMLARAERILKGAAAMQDVTVSITRAGGALSMVNDQDLSEEIYQIASALPVFHRVDMEIPSGGSEDCSYFMDRVRSHGGKVCYMGLGMNLTAVHHNSFFDLDEAVLTKGVAVLGAIAEHYLR